MTLRGLSLVEVDDPPYGRSNLAPRAQNLGYGDKQGDTFISLCAETRHLSVINRSILLPYICVQFLHLTGNFFYTLKLRKTPKAYPYAEILRHIKLLIFDGTTHGWKQTASMHYDTPTPTPGGRYRREATSRVLLLTTVPVSPSWCVQWGLRVCLPREGCWPLGDCRRLAEERGGRRVTGRCG